jgi:uridine phosphorylase
MSFPDMISKLNTFESESRRITNLEMETAGIYALAHSLGHEALSINAILASRVQKVFSKNPQEVVNKAIEYILERI